MKILAIGKEAPGGITGIIHTAMDGLEGKRLFENGLYDLVLSEVRLPGLNGLDLCRFIRRQDQHIPLILLTDNPGDKLHAFHAGADDCLVRPFDRLELEARIEVLLKRAGPPEGVLKAGDLSLDLGSKEVTQKGQPVPLTAKEFQLLEYFVRHKNKLLSRADIARDVWEIDFDTRTNIIDVYVNFLRKKLGRELIHTHVGMGYILKTGAGYHPG